MISIRSKNGTLEKNKSMTYFTLRNSLTSRFVFDRVMYWGQFKAQILVVWLSLNLCVFFYNKNLIYREVRAQNDRIFSRAMNKKGQHPKSQYWEKRLWKFASLTEIQPIIIHEIYFFSIYIYIYIWQSATYWDFQWIGFQSNTRNARMTSAYIRLHFGFRLNSKSSFLDIVSSSSRPKTFTSEKQLRQIVHIITTWNK